MTLKIIDTVVVKIENKRVFVAVEFDLLTGVSKILGIEVFEFDPMITRKPENEEERVAIEFVKELLKKEDPQEIFGKEFEVRTALPSLL